MQRFHNFLKAYKQTHFHRSFLVSPKWRLFVVLLVLATMLVVQEYLENKYLTEFEQSPLAYAVLDKALYWFAVGIVVGAAAIFLMFEGEFAIGVWKRMRSIEHVVAAEMTGMKMLKARVLRAKGRKRRKKK